MMNQSCPYPKGLKLVNPPQTFDDALLPPFPTELKWRFYIEYYGKIKGVKKWTKLLTEDVFVRVRK